MPEEPEVGGIGGIRKPETPKVLEIPEFSRTPEASGVLINRM